MRPKILVALTTFMSIALAAESGMELYQKAVTQERAGKMEDAIKLYEKVAHDFAAERPLAAKALLQAATGYEKLGQDKAKNLYEQLTREYSDQREAATARAKLAALRQAPPATMTVRQITPLGSPITESSAGAYVTFHSDGQHALYLDNNAGGVVFSDLSGSNKRVIFKNTPNRSVIALVPSRDYSMTDLVVADAAGERTTAVIKSDGTGYREVYKGPRPLCTPSFSWDNHYILLCPPQPEGGTRLIRISVADGKAQEIMQGRDIVVAKFSPDGNRIAYMSPAGQIFVVPSHGGEPQLVFDRAQRLLDWTRDGRYLAIASDRSGATALSLLPLKEGKAAGEPVFVRYGSFTDGRTTASGALVHTQVPPRGNFDSWMAELDARGNPGEWKRLNLSASSDNSIGPSWSADEASIVYSTPNLAAGQNTYTVRLRNLASGEERELYGSRAGTVGCRPAAQHASLFCHLRRDGMTELFTLAPDSGHVEQIGSLPGTRSLVMSNHDDTALYMRNLDPRDRFGLIRWEIATGRETVVEQDLGFTSAGLASLDERWIVRLNKDSIEIRPLEGGSWRRLVSRRSEISGQFTFTPDGEWFLYHDKDSAGKDGFFRVSTAGGEPQRLSDFPSGNMNGLLWISRSGRKIVAEALNNGPEFWILENYAPQAAK
jgi:Tol biopolymer transport system component